VADRTEAQLIDSRVVSPELREAVVYYEFTRRNLEHATEGMRGTLTRCNREAEAELVRLLRERGSAAICDGHRYAVAFGELYRQRFLAPGQKCRKPQRAEED
jgi:hypothetical protein